MRIDEVIKQEGLHALKAKLNPIELKQFLVIINREKFDYTKWRKKLLENMTIEELAEKFSEEL